MQIVSFSVSFKGYASHTGTCLYLQSTFEKVSKLDHSVRSIGSVMVGRGTGPRDSLTRCHL